MRRKKFTKIFVSMLCIIALIVPSSTEVLAALSHTRANAQIEISKMHPGGPESTGTLPEAYKSYYDETSYAYKIKDVNIFKIREVGDNNFSDALYCLDATKEFPAEGGLSYNNVADLYDSTAPAVRALGLSEENYKSLIWLIENIYVKSPVVNQKDELLGKAFEEKIAYDAANNVIPPTTVDLVKTFLTDDDIDVIQQWALWYYTNNNDDKYKTLGSINISTDGTNFNDYLSTLGDAGTVRREYATILYNYLITAAKDAKEITYPKIQTNQDDLKAIVEGDYYKVGPFNISSGTISKESYSIKLKDANGNEINKSLYQIKIEGEEDFTNKSVDEIFDVNYYVYIPKTEKSITNMKLELKYSLFATKASLWTYQSSSIYQPLTLITKEVENKTEEINTTIDIIECDLALRKYIIKIGEKDITTRIPVVDTTALRNKTATTAEYKHPKDPLSVKVGQKIVYEITAYNEHQSEATATQIKDYLPKGLTYVANSESEINTKYGWVISADGRTATTAYTSDYKLSPFDPVNNEMSSVSVQIECIVDDTNNVGDILTNGAEITADDIDDLDSSPKDLDTSIIDDKYKGNEENKEDLSDPEYHYKGQQDDDDFEKVIIVKDTNFDLALRKFITHVNNKEVSPSREPVVDLTKLISGESTTATYTHPKSKVEVEPDDTIIYTIRIYNEGNVDGIAEEVTDYLPSGLTLAENSEINTKYGWTNPSKDGQTIVTEYLKDTEIPAFNGTSLAYVDLQVECKVVAKLDKEDQQLKNIAEITKDNGEDRDSEPGTVLPKDYPEEGNIQDDDDYENLIIKGKSFDLALRKFITKINGIAPSASREPVVDVTGLRDGTSTTAKYIHPKYALTVEQGDIVIYTVRVYNEGDIAGYAEQIADYLPEGLGFLVNHKVNVDNYWSIPENSQSVKLSTIENGKARLNITDFVDVEKLDDVEVVPGKIKVTSSKLKYNENDDSNILKEFDKEDENSTLDYKDIQIACIVLSKTVKNTEFKNIAEVSKDLDKNGDEIEDRDSVPDTVIPEEYPKTGNIQDDDDYEKLTTELKKFDLSLRKFITGVNDTEVTNRIPVVSKDADGNLIYTHTKEPVLVTNGDLVTYTLRIYNEGEIAGYAQEVTDNIPTGLVFVPENETNTEYEWKMYDDDGKETTDVTKAVTVKTDYLSKEKSEKRGENNLIKVFDKELELSNEKGNLNPDYRDIKIVFKITEKKIPSDRILINTAEISDDADEDGNPVDDVDSTPGNDKDDEDDIDNEYVKVKYFDLALLKWVSQVVVIEDGVETVTDTGHTGYENPEPIVKVDINRKKINTTVVKFVYTIRITNEGEIPGYATEITDYVPEGLEFYPEDNPVWLEESNGIITTSGLAKTLLNPGESVDIQITLRWINDPDNLGTKTNVAEISEDYNIYGAEDIDSIPNNKKTGEDDIDDAPVLLTITTGTAPTYIALTIGILIMFAVGIFIIRKYILN